jgi:hypothetical protein
MTAIRLRRSPSAAMASSATAAAPALALRLATLYPRDDRPTLDLAERCAFLDELRYEYPEGQAGRIRRGLQQLVEAGLRRRYGNCRSNPTSAN